MAVLAQGVEDVLEVDGVKDHDGVGHEGEAQRLFGLLVVVAAPDVALVGEEDPPAEGVKAFAFVELAVDPPAQVGVGQVGRWGCRGSRRGRRSRTVEGITLVP